MKRILSIAIAVLCTAFLSFAQSSFDSRYEEAKKYYMSSNYSAAIESLNHTLSVENLTKEQKDKVNRLINQCKQEIEAAKKLVISKKDFTDLNFLGEKVSTYVTVPSKKAWTVVSSPAWITYETESDRIVFTVHENTSHAQREGEVEITLDKTSTSWIHFIQDGRPETEKTVNIATVPETVQLMIDESQMDASPTSMVMKSGKHTIRAQKNMYETLDTTIVIKDDLNKEQVNLVLKLARKFATVSVDIKDEDNTEILNSPEFFIDGKKIDLRPNIIGDYNEFKKIEFNTLYSDGTIPIQTGSHVFSVSAPGYYEQETVLKNTMEDVDYNLVFKLSPKAGYLNISSVFDAEGADIFIDGKQVAGKKVPCDSVKVITGKHILTFKKDGMLSSKETYPVDIVEGTVSNLGISMVGCDTYTFGSGLPVGASVKIDTTEIGKSPFSTTLVKGRYNIHIEKPGYLPIDDYLIVEGTNRHIDYDKAMDATMPFEIWTDENYLLATITQKDRTIVSNAFTTQPMQVPLSDKKYKLVLTRGNRQKTAYRGTFKFNDPSKNILRVQSWSEQFYHIVEADYYLNNQPFTIAGKEYNKLMNVAFLNIKLFKGVSTSLAKGKLFLASDESLMQVGDKQLEGNNVIPAISCILINEDLRIGGAICQYVDANILASYAWYPAMTAFLPISHVSGHDVFAGVEVSSRFPVLTVSLKAGYETLINGKTNIYVKEEGMSNTGTAEKFISSPLDFGQFVFGVSVSIGDVKTKGNNIIRVF